MMTEHDYEPIPGLPAPLPAGETILWQGAPRWDVFANRALKVRWVIGYFVALVLWGIAGRLTSGAPVGVVTLAMLRLGALAVVAVGVLLLFAWLVGRTTLYTITTRRIVMRLGIALPITIQIPFRMIDAAGVRVGADGGGEIALTLLPGQKVAYFALWPHARPWKLGHPQPALRGLADAASVAQVLGRALAASAAQPAKAVKIDVSTATGTGSHVPAAA